MITEIIYDMFYFTLILFMAVFAFANSFHILGKNSEGTGFAGENILYSFAFSYRIGLGDFDTDRFNEQDKYLIWLLWFGNTLFILIVLLNLVIALMGDTFDRVQET